MPLARKLIPLLFVLLWSTGFIGARYAMPWAEPFTFLAVRFGLAMVILAGIAAVLAPARAEAKARGTKRKEAASSIATGVLMHGVYLGGIFWAVREGLGAGLAALIGGLQPLISAVLAGALLGEKVRPRQWLGLITGLAGVVMVILPKLGAGLDAVTMPMLVAALTAVGGLSLGTILQKKIGGSADLVRGTAWQYVGAAALMFTASLVFETRTFVLTGELVFAMAWLVLVLSIGAIFLLMIMIRDGAMAKVSSLFYLVPPVTAVIAWVLFGESLTPVQVAGMAVATFGVALATAQEPTRARASR
ncbi:DMT family transporter [Pseudaminobacter sp. 19-2017]|uniref:DMT family transporter n=1 Tax=Pseudaminobacter soli (ex Zhang et al. 2022) TaxID=2831468 RepID=A0A942DZJ0_9HYPH|nr:DMT family transporter [Pseudaminobacter soli]MBS3647980.1 DMT family transporter [Pseudaminobacter soli]